VSTHPVCSTSAPPLKRSVNSASKLTHRPVGGYHIIPLPWRLSSGPSSCPYSPECVEGVF
jgi:hypothetical protein